MNQNFSKSKILHESFKLENFEWGEKFGDLGFRDLGVENFRPIESLDFQQLSFF